MSRLDGAARKPHVKPMERRGGVQWGTRWGLVGRDCRARDSIRAQFSLKSDSTGHGRRVKPPEPATMAPTPRIRRGALNSGRRSAPAPLTPQEHKNGIAAGYPVMRCFPLVVEATAEPILHATGE
jgi:hypothetical protein